LVSEFDNLLYKFEPCGFGQVLFSL
jgi:hypothetical protein